MTDLTPNDLSQMSDEDFNALCPQGHHAPGAEPLSPAAQAVLDAFKQQVELTWLTKDFEQVGLAAALREAADTCDSDWTGPTVIHHLYAIADELENTNG